VVEIRVELEHRHRRRRGDGQRRAGVVAECMCLLPPELAKPARGPARAGGARTSAGSGRRRKLGRGQALAVGHAGHRRRARLLTLEDSKHVAPRPALSDLSRRRKVAGERGCRRERVEQPTWALVREGHRYVAPAHAARARAGETHVPERRAWDECGRGRSGDVRARGARTAEQVARGRARGERIERRERWLRERAGRRRL
jgi:hypothetical protein